MISQKIKVLKNHGYQSIPSLDKVSLSSEFKGRPKIKTGCPIGVKSFLADLCPVSAIGKEPFIIDLGKCIFCGECEKRYPEHIKFTTDYILASGNRSSLIVKEGLDEQINIRKDLIRPEIKNKFQNTLKLRQVSAGGDNSNEMELNAASNVNFDMGRFGIEFVASPRHADGIVITGPITENMRNALELCWLSVPEPKVLILVGFEAISLEIYNIPQGFLIDKHVDLYVPGNPIHPLSFINGCLDYFFL